MGVEDIVEVGSRVFLRTVTLYYVGEVTGIADGWLRLVKASWVADTGRFGAAMASGRLAEVECYPPEMEVLVNLTTVVDIVRWPHKLPEQSTPR